MDLHFLHTVSGLAIILSLLCKVSLHFYIDYEHQRDVSLSTLLVMPLLYLRPYKSPVNADYIKWKYLCNSFLLLTGISLLLNIIFGILIYTL
jgi:hypothetical protein